MDEFDEILNELKDGEILKAYVDVLKVDYKLNEKPLRCYRTTTQPATSESFSTGAMDEMRSLYERFSKDEWDDFVADLNDVSFDKQKDRVGKMATSHFLNQKACAEGKQGRFNRLVGKKGVEEAQKDAEQRGEYEVELVYPPNTVLMSIQGQHVGVFYTKKANPVEYIVEENSYINYKDFLDDERDEQ